MTSKYQKLFALHEGVSIPAKDLKRQKIGKERKIQRKKEVNFFKSENWKL